MKPPYISTTPRPIEEAREMFTPAKVIGSIVTLLAWLAVIYFILGSWGGVET